MDSFSNLVTISAALMVFPVMECQLGVIYSPFVKLNDTPAFTDSYTQKDVQTMLEILVDDNINHVATWSVGAPSEPYQFNVTRYKSSSAVHTALAAAQLNKERNQRNLTIFQGLNINGRNGRWVNTEIEVGLEVAKEANKIYPGTVTAIIFPSFAEFDDLFEILEEIKYCSFRVKNNGMKFGARIRDCDNKIPGVDSNNSKAKLLQLFDFIICKNVHYLENQANTSANDVKIIKERIVGGILNVEKSLHRMGVDTQVILETGWVSHKGQPYKRERKLMGNYWEAIWEWASRDGRLVFMHEAFDSPWNKYWGGNYGLWSHLKKRNNSRSSYRRKGRKRNNTTIRIGPLELKQPSSTAKNQDFTKDLRQQNNFIELNTSREETDNTTRFRHSKVSNEQDRNLSTV
ncbi:unnamed protein product [Orchesella dallaii]|uniref:Uncharacterized protein n=1 Tax=Orchesella dallaii TaxID=48710 RepID=A0ABP1RVV9_9HEXA